MSVAGKCPPGSDNVLGPRVATNCRQFDFTLLFEDGFFAILPAALFTLAAVLQLRPISRQPVKVVSFKLAIWKLTLLAALLLSHVLFLVFRLQNSQLRTKLSISAATLNITAVVAASVESFLHDQKSLKPSDLMVFYFSISAILFIPLLRSLWLMPNGTAPAALWTVVYVLTVCVAGLESARKRRILRPSYKEATAEQTTGFWERSLFIWVLPLFRAGYSRSISLEDIPEPDLELREQSAWTDLYSSWARPSTPRFRLIRATFRANAKHIVSVIAPRLCLAAFTFCQPFLVSSSVTYLGNRKNRSPEEKPYGPALVGAFILAYAGIAVSRAIYWRQAYRMIARVRSGLTAMVYRHTLTMKAQNIKESEAVTLMGTDVERIVDALSRLHELWASFFEIAVATWLLARQISYAALVPLAVCIASVAGASHIASRFGTAQKGWNECVQRRIALTINMLSDMKTVKMLGLSNTLSKLITKSRVVELKTSERFRSLRIWVILISNAPATLAPFFTFAVYAGIAKSRHDESLLSAQAFASLSLIVILTNPLLTFCQVLPIFFQGLSCFGRVEAFLVKEGPVPADDSMRPISSRSDPSGTELAELSSAATNKPLFSLDKADVYWSQDAQTATLRNVSLTIESGLTAIVGPVASGKSTLLATVIGETFVKSGVMTTYAGQTFAYCPQTPWAMNRTIRENITGGLQFDEKWYNHSISICQLEQDLAKIPDGDQTMAGSNGSSLSGGQRQRVALARAVYSRLSVVILDDVLSGLDQSTAENIIVHLFGRQGHFRKRGISVILATHNTRVLSHMDRVISLEAGTLADSKTLEALDHSDGRNPQQNPHRESTSQTIEGDDDIQGEAETPNAAVNATTSKDKAQSDTEPQQRRYGSWPVYRYYFQSANPWSLIFWAVFTVIGGFASSFATIWIDIWTDANEKRPNEQLGLYLGIYALVVLLANLGVAGECWVFFIQIITQTALKMHTDLLDATMGASYGSLQQSDTGSLTNRFSQDMDLIDMRLPSNAIQFTTGATSSVIQLVILCVLGKYLAAAIPLLAGVLFLLQRYYLRLSRQVRLLDIEAKAPLYKQFVETEQGLASIQAFGWATAFSNTLAQILDRAQRPFYMLFCIQQWLELVLDCIVGALAVIVVAVATSVTNSISPGALGVSLVLVLQFNSVLTQTIRSWTGLETSIGAVFRVQQFIQETAPEDTATVEPGTADADWPKYGAVEYRNVVASYSPEAATTLDDVTLSIKAGEKLAVCGASGSGKTSLILATLKMVDVKSGSIIIDGVDISKYAADDVRSHLNIVPQDSYFIPGSIRLNLDPKQGADDDTLKQALQEVGLWEKVQDKSSSTSSLDSELVTAEWSQGEKQLFCLARALLVPSKVVILDEATSSVDEATEAIMQRVIDDRFRNCTVISVLHRFAYIDRFDRVAVMRAGHVVECDTPTALLARDSAFRELYNSELGKRRR